MMFKIKNTVKKDVNIGDTISYYTSNEGWVPFMITDINVVSGRVFGRVYGRDNSVYLFDLHQYKGLKTEDRIRTGVHSGYKNI